MKERKSGNPKTRDAAPAAWHVPVAVADLAETGQQFALVADDATRAAVARVARLRELPRLQANFDVTRRGARGLHVAGFVSATVGQNCVVTLEPLTSEIEEAIDLTFVPQQAPAPEPGAKPEPRDVKWGDPEPLIGGIVDLGALVTEFLILGLDPYPRKPGAEFEPPQEGKPDEGPFAALSKLTKG
jgi:Large ribosomal RNA subunit accumulation protein YceD